MRFSVVLNARSMRSEEDWQLMRDLGSHALRAGELGFSAIFMPDHHFNGYMPIASDSFIFAAYLAAKLPDMHFGFSVVSVPLHHPVRFVERINILNQLTDGKLLVGVGSGTSPEEMIGFGVDYKDAGAIADRNLHSPRRCGRRAWRMPRSSSTTARTRAACSSGSRLRPTPRGMCD